MRLERPIMPRQIVPVALAVACLLAFVFDHWVYDHVHLETVYNTDLGRLLRIVGFWPTWGVVAFAVWLHDGRVRSTISQRAVLLAATPAIAGVVGEVIKLLVRRERPGLHNGAYAFRAFADRPFSTVGLGLPSSHAAVAFGAAAIMARLFPRARWVWFTLALGCGATRVLARAHFVSDVVLGAALAYTIEAWLWAWSRRNP
jgi:membrane-associated phospholipid phosphatase